MKIRANSIGRSMVEMLGVLAIIGVLSAGALKGYSNAMFKHKMNKTIEIFNGVVQKVIELEQKDLGSGFSLTDGDEAIKYGVLPECQKSGYDCKLPIGTLDFDLYYCSNKYLCGSIIAQFTSSKECVAFASVHWENVMPVEWFNNPEYSEYGGSVWITNWSHAKTIYNPHDQTDEIIVDYDLSTITEACSVCDTNGSCGVGVTIHFLI